MYSLLPCTKTKDIGLNAYCAYSVHILMCATKVVADTLTDFITTHRAIHCCCYRYCTPALCTVQPCGAFNSLRLEWLIQKHTDRPAPRLPLTLSPSCSLYSPPLSHIALSSHPSWAHSWSEPKRALVPGKTRLSFAPQRHQMNPANKRHMDA